jgi:Fic family protein
MKQYVRIQDLPQDFCSADADSAESLGLVWRERYADIQKTAGLKEFNERLYRAWAIETGIIERIYSIDVGTTLVLIEQGLNAALIPNEATDQPPERVAEIVQSHRNAVDAILDQISQHHGLTNHFIRSLHQKITETQHEVEGVDQFGNKLKLPLLRGAWKQQPNNPTRTDGITHAYCPPVLVEEEMNRLNALYDGLINRRVGSIVRSAWLHHRFTQIHPFQDGNGRVARALVAFVLIGDGLFPIVVKREDRESRYLPALESADLGDLNPLVSLFAEYEKLQITSAMSIIEDLPHVATPLDAILAAARERLVEKEQILRKEQQGALSVADDLHKIMAKSVIALADRLNEEVLFNGQHADFQASIPNTSHWFRRQVGEVAKSQRYFADMEIYHRWVRLRIRESVQGHAEIVLSLHPLGRPFSGVMAANAFFARRDVDEDGRSDTGPIASLAKTPFSFTYREKVPEIERRFAIWLNEVLAIGMEEWRRQL